MTEEFEKRARRQAADRVIEAFKPEGDASLALLCRLEDTIVEAMLEEHNFALERVEDLLEADIRDDNAPEVVAVLRTLKTEVVKMRRALGK